MLGLPVTVTWECLEVARKVKQVTHIIPRLRYSVASNPLFIYNFTYRIGKIVYNKGLFTTEYLSQGIADSSCNYFVIQHIDHN